MRNIASVLVLSLAAVSVASAQMCLFGGSYVEPIGKCLHLFTVPQTFLVAREICSAIGGGLVTIPTAFDQAFLTEIANSSTSDYWIGLSDLKQKNTWEWDDGTNMSYSNWDSGNPTSNGGDCVTSQPAQGKWHNADCATKMNFVCAVVVDEAHKADQTMCPGSTLSQGDFDKCFYAMKVKVSNAEASALCANIRGTLTSVRNQSENAAIGALASNQLDADYWIGLHQDEEGFGWTWDDYSTSKYSNWHTGFPAVDGGNCASASLTDGTWSNKPCETTSNYFVCGTSGGWTYFNVTKAWYKTFGYEIGNWISYERKCKQEGGHLSSVHSDDESTFLTDFVGFPWIGLHCVNGNLSNFVWTDGTPLDFNQFPSETQYGCCVRLESGRWGTYYCDLLYSDGVCKVIA